MGREQIGGQRRQVTMAEYWQYWDAYYRSSYPGGETLDVGTSHFNQGSGFSSYPPSDGSNATATSSSAAVFSGHSSNVGPAKT